MIKKVQREQFYQRLKPIYLLEQSGMDAQLTHNVLQTDQIYRPERTRLRSPPVIAFTWRSARPTHHVNSLGCPELAQRYRSTPTSPALNRARTDRQPPFHSSSHVVTDGYAAACSQVGLGRGGRSHFTSLSVWPWIAREKSSPFWARQPVWRLAPEYAKPSTYNRPSRRANRGMYLHSRVGAECLHLVYDPLRLFGCSHSEFPYKALLTRPLMS
jgi:hypothetical protein